MEVGFHVGVTTNNGLESLNNSIKNSYLKLSGTGTLSAMVETMVMEFIPHLLLEYININYVNSNQYKLYNPTIPSYLHNRPRNVVKKCIERYHSAEYCKAVDITEVSAGSFRVKSETNNTVLYNVSLGDATTYPFCECAYFSSTCLPCKHMFALFRNDKAHWDQMSPLYRESPYLTLDNSVLTEGALDSQHKNDQTEERWTCSTKMISLHWRRKKL